MEIYICISYIKKKSVFFIGYIHYKKDSQHTPLSKCICNLNMDPALRDIFKRKFVDSVCQISVIYLTSEMEV